jgi:hypothetical protein
MDWRLRVFHSTDGVVELETVGRERRGVQRKEEEDGQAGECVGVMCEAWLGRAVCDIDGPVVDKTRSSGHAAFGVRLGQGIFHTKPGAKTHTWSRAGHDPNTVDFAQVITGRQIGHLTPSDCYLFRKSHHSSLSVSHT